MVSEEPLFSSLLNCKFTSLFPLFNYEPFQARSQVSFILVHNTQNFTHTLNSIVENSLSLWHLEKPYKYLGNY